MEWVRQHCMSLPHVTEQVQWENDLVFKIGGKMFTVMSLIPTGTRMAFKTAPDVFAELVERPHIIPAPYMARAQWVALETWDALPRAEIKKLIEASYHMVFAKLTKKAQAELSATKPVAPKKKKKA